MILVNMYKNGEKGASFSVTDFVVDYEKKLVKFASPIINVTYKWIKFSHEHVTGCDYHILSVEVDDAEK